MAQIGILLGFILNLPVASRFEDQHIGRLVLYEDEPPKTLNGATHFIAKELLELWRSGLGFRTIDGQDMFTKVALLFTKADWPALTKLSGTTISMHIYIFSSPYCWLFALMAAGLPSHSCNTPCPRCNETEDHECKQMMLFRCCVWRATHVAFL